MTISLRQDGSPDWDKVISPYGYSDSVLRDFYIAALERCAELTETMTSIQEEERDIALAELNLRAALVRARSAQTSAGIATTIRRWIEKEKANG